MPGNKYNSNPGHAPSRVERLLRESWLRKRACHTNETADISRVAELDHELRYREGENSGISYVEQFLEGAVAARALTEGCERQDGRPLRQRLLVVANRLPVSAVRRGEDSWSLEMSGGGLVTALLGKYHLVTPFPENSNFLLQPLDN